MPKRGEELAKELMKQEVDLSLLIRETSQN
jgi:hypothetical protein